MPNEGLVFPRKERYDYVNTTLEGENITFDIAMVLLTVRPPMWMRWASCCSPTMRMTGGMTSPLHLAHHLRICMCLRHVRMVAPRRVLRFQTTKLSPRLNRRMTSVAIATA